MLVGYAILRARGWGGYINYSLVSSMKLGALGAVASGFVVPVFCYRVRFPVILACGYAYGSIIGLVGFVILGRYGHKGTILDPLHAVLMFAYL